MNVIELLPEELPEATKTLTRAFFNYPDLSYYFQDEKKRFAQLYWMLHCDLIQVSRVGKLLRTDDASGYLALKLPNSRQKNLWDQIAGGAYKAPFMMSRESLTRMRFCESYTLKKHMQIMAGKPHYYIWYLGVEPDSQHKGAGSTLIHYVQNLASKSGHPVYLETHRAVTIAYYQKLGFKILAENQIPGYPIIFTNLLWEPS